jgi:response regulator RpfG family c-di-GMP phosphodiesterase
MGLGDEEVSIIERGALLHDLGKVIISDTVLLKPGPLSEEEWLIIKQHTHTGYDLLKDINFLKPALDVLHYHHERWDGTGYPQGLIGEQIPLSARIFAVVDVWENLISERPFRPAYSKTDAINFLRQQSGYAFDPCIVKVFINSPMVKKLLDNKPKLLIVDDEPLITSTLERSLRTDFDVYTANSGEDAIRILQQNIFQIILTDQRMPDLTGIQLLRMANKIQPSIVGVLISAYLDTKVLADAINLGNVYGFIEKPWNTMDLHNKLMQISSMSKSVCQ